jgi:hypothetical protein
MKDPRDLIVAGGGSLSSTGFARDMAESVVRGNPNRRSASMIADNRIQHSGAML